MARQSTTPVQFQMTNRRDARTSLSSGRAGVVNYIDYIPVLPMDSGSGSMALDFDLAEMPRPLRNGAMVNAQAWFVPKTAFPQFSSTADVMHAWQGADIKTHTAAGEASRTPSDFFLTISGATTTTAAGSEMFKALGLHVPAGATINVDLIDAFWLVYNFRLAAHSSRLTLQGYAHDDITAATTFPRAFWPKGRFSTVVPDYEQALVVGSLDLDVVAGQLPIANTYVNNSPNSNSRRLVNADGTLETTASISDHQVFFKGDGAGGVDPVFAEMAGQSIGITLKDIDMARVTQAMGKLRTAYAGNDTTGYASDDAIIATLMQGIQVPSDAFRRPILLDSSMVPFGFTERFATDAANLDDSVTQGRAGVRLSLNIPKTEFGGVVVITAEILPERLDERQSDEWLFATTPDDLPNALRDVQRPEPVDMVLNRRLDALHTTPDALYGYEPMNGKWSERAFTRFGGAFYQSDPLNPFVDQRSAIWQTSIVDPVFSTDHWLAPADFPHDVFSDTLAPAYEVMVQRDVTFRGLTQQGDMLEENNLDFAAVEAETE